MPDPSLPPGLPGRRTPPAFAPTGASLDAALRRGRHRRAATGTAASAALLLVPAVLYVALGSGTQRNDSLVATPPTPVPAVSGQQVPTPGPVPTADPSPAAPEPTLTSAPGPDSPATRAPVVVPQAPQDTPRTPRPDADQTANPAETQPGRPARTFPVTRDTVAYTADSCQYSPGTGAAAGWCIGSPGAFSTRQGQPVKLRQLLCRVPASGSREATFPRANEVVFHIYDGQSKTRWKSTRDTRSDEHSVTVADNTCVRWTITWDARDDAGEIVRPGNYSLENTIDANLSGINQSEAYAFPYDFNVTE